MCNICKGHFSDFVTLATGELLCPACGSLPRHRRLWEILQDMHHTCPELEILHFSPSRIISVKMKKMTGAHYHASELSKGRKADFHYDITSIQAPPDAFDLVVCYHVLEHVKEDRQAISELYRVTRPGGTVLIQVPLKPGVTYENAAILTKQEKRAHFGQEDHVRIYSEEGLRERLINAGFGVSPVVYHSDEVYGMREKETVFFCKKPIFAGTTSK